MGLFALARRATGNRLRILGYHGLALNDEHCFRPGLFMRPEVLRKRFETLHCKKYPVLSLEEALEKLATGNLPQCATVVTFDDGFYSFYRHGLGILQEFSFPATVYVTTYYVAKGTPIFRLVVQYVFWKTDRTVLDLSGLHVRETGVIDLSDPAVTHRAMWAIIEFAETQLDEAQRCALSQELAGRLGVDYENLVQNRALGLMTSEEMRSVESSGVDIQLHTHRHRFPLDRDVVDRELEDNRVFLENMLGKPVHHFCYPSGIWSREHWPWLQAAGIQSATTCESGLNNPDTPRLGLCRFLDADDLSQIEFESAMSGFTEILQRLRRLKAVQWAWSRPRRIITATSLPEPVRD